MSEFFKDIFEYHHHFNQKMADQFLEHHDQISERTIPLFSHLINAHQIWNSRILKTASLGVNQVHAVEKGKDLDLLNYEDTLKILSSFDLKTKIEYKNSKGTAFENSTRDSISCSESSHTS